MAKRIAVVPGDGIGKEVTPAAMKVVEATGAAVEFTVFDWSAHLYLKDGTTIPPDGFVMLAPDFAAVFLGALRHPPLPSNIHPTDTLPPIPFKIYLSPHVPPGKP